MIVRSVLIVDDEADALELLSYNLKAAGYEVMTACDGAQALNKARTLAPSLVLLDVMLPEIDGLEVCRILRRDPTTYDLPIIMVTARATEMSRMVGLESGADAYLTKPVRPRVVVASVNAVSFISIQVFCVPKPFFFAKEERKQFDRSVPLRSMRGGRTCYGSCPSRPYL